MGQKATPVTQISGYILHDRVGSGGFGVVWRATHVATQRTVAIKLLKQRIDRESRARFLREGKILQRLNHPACLRYLDVGHAANGAPYLATEFVAGESLNRWAQTNPSLQQKLVVAAQIADGLAHAHHKSVIHRDIKPNNIMVHDGSAKVLDFGIAKLLGVEFDDITKTGVIVGSPGYMSPEQMRGARAVGAATDQYSLGVVLFELFAGEPPFRGDSAMELCVAHLTNAPPRATGLPSELADIVHRMMAKEPAGRWPSMSEVADRLSVLADRPRFQEPLADVSKDSRSTWAMPRVALAVVAAIGAAAVVGLLAQSDTDVPTVRTAPIRARGVVPMVDESREQINDARQPSGPDVSAEVTPSCGALDLRPGEIFSTNMGSLYVPSSYDGVRKFGVLALLHDANERPAKLVTAPHWQDLAERLDLVVIVPDGSDRNDALVSVVGMPTQPWTGDPIRKARQWVMQHVEDSPCLDGDRIYIAGGGRGGRGAEGFLCDGKNLGGIVVWNHRPKQGWAACGEARNPTRYMYVEFDDHVVHSRKPLLTREQYVSWLRDNNRSNKRAVRKGKACRRFDGDAPVFECTFATFGPEFLDEVENFIGRPP